MMEQEDKKNFRQNCLQRQQSREKIVILFGTKLFQICFLPTFLHFALVAFGKLIFQKPVTKQLFAWGFCVVQQGTLYHHHDYGHGNFYKKLRHLIVGRSVRDVKTT